MHVSLIASAIRVPFYETFMDSLKGTTVDYEVVFAGHNTPEEIEPIKAKYPEFRYVHTDRIKPAQCYEVARRSAIGETVIWVADDCEFSLDCVGKAYRFWKELNDYKSILSIQTLENGMFVNMKVHSFFGGNFATPIMAPLGLMSRKFLEDIGGFDRRYLCGQYENDVVMRAIQDGASVYIFGDAKNLITIDHYRRHGIVRPFAKGYNKDREILEASWTDGRGGVLAQQKDEFEPYEDTDILTKSQSTNIDLWV